MLCWRLAVFPSVSAHPAISQSANTSTKRPTTIGRPVPRAEDMPSSLPFSRVRVLLGLAQPSAKPEGFACLQGATGSSIHRIAEKGSSRKPDFWHGPLYSPRCREELSEKGSRLSPGPPFYGPQ